MKNSYARRAATIKFSLLLICTVLLVGCDGLFADLGDLDYYAEADVGEPDAGEPDTGEPDAGEPVTGELQLTGGVAPGGGIQMSNDYTLKGGVVSPTKSTTLQSADYTLTGTPTMTGGE